MIRIFRQSYRNPCSVGCGRKGDKTLRAVKTWRRVRYNSPQNGESPTTVPRLNLLHTSSTLCRTPVKITLYQKLLDVGVRGHGQPAVLC